MNLQLLWKSYGTPGIFCNKTTPLFFGTKLRLYFLEQNCVFIFGAKLRLYFLEQNCVFIFEN